MKTRLFESEGIFISIIFTQNLDREPSWRFKIDNVEDELFESGKYFDYSECENRALKKAIEYLP